MEGTSHSALAQVKSSPVPASGPTYRVRLRRSSPDFFAQSGECGDMLAVFYLLPVPEMGCAKSEALRFQPLVTQMNQLLTQRAMSE